MILAADVGGTKTLVGLFRPAPRRPEPVEVRNFATQAFDSLSAIVDAFFAARGRADRLEAACVGVAGPVVGGAVRLTNVPWAVSRDELARATSAPRVWLVNDVAAMAHAVAVLEPAELHTLQAGTPVPGGNAALIAAGTGLGEAVLHHVDGRFVPVASEGGHADFAARNDREIALLRMLLAEAPRVDLERVVSGPGLAAIHRFTHGGQACAAAVDVRAGDAPAAIAQAAIDGRCSRCAEALDLFVSAYGAAAGNLALRAVATAGVYVGGGIAPKILPALERGGFLEAFRAKTPMEALLEAMPVHVILNPEAGLLGAAVCAATAAAP